MPEDIGLIWGKDITNLEAKKAIAKMVAAKAAKNEIIGAGSGSTSFLTVLELGRRSREEGLNLTMVPTSIEIALACEAMGLRTLSFIPGHIDWCFDGADEIDPQNRLIKGRGGALYNEKLVFLSSSKIYVVADESKSVRRLGERFSVPVEVDKWTIKVAMDRINAMPHVESCQLRYAVSKDGPVITENGRVVLDVKMSEITAEDEKSLEAIPGVAGTGIFSGFDYERIKS